MLEGHNEPIIFAYVIFGNYFLEVDHKSYQAQPSPVPSDTQLELLLYIPTNANEIYNIYVHTTGVGTIPIATNIWTLYFVSSKTHDGSTVGCILSYPHKKRYILSCHLEFECMNNIVEYEALILGLKKAIDLKVELLKVIGD